MISATINPGSDRVAEFILKRKDAITEGLFAEIKAISIDLQSYIKREKLSGQVLKNRTGNLRRAIDRAVERDSKSISAVVGVAPNASKYAAAHEFGAEINIPAVSGKLMVFDLGGKTIFTMKHKAFTVHMPERSFLRSALKDKKQEFFERLNKAVSIAAVK